MSFRKIFFPSRFLYLSNQPDSENSIYMNISNTLSYDKFPNYPLIVKLPSPWLFLLDSLMEIGNICFPYLRTFRDTKPLLLVSHRLYQWRFQKYGRKWNMLSISWLNKLPHHFSSFHRQTIGLSNHPTLFNEHVTAQFKSNICGGQRFSDYTIVKSSTLKLYHWCTWRFVSKVMSVK